MKYFYVIILITIFSAFAVGQTSKAESEFLKNKSKLSLEKYALGEDATSGYDYLVYKNKGKIVKIRSIHSSTNPSMEIDDYYFENGKLVVYLRSYLPKKSLKSALRGNEFKLFAQERIELKDDKMIVWSDGAKKYTSDDPNWLKRENQILQSVGSELEMIRMLMEEK